MKVSEAIAMLERMNPDDNLVIDYDIGHVTVARRPSMAIKGLYPGFDWENGEVRICAETRLCAPSDEFSNMSKNLKTSASVMGNLYYTLSHRASTPEFKVKECLKIIKEKK